MIRKKFFFTLVNGFLLGMFFVLFDTFLKQPLCSREIVCGHSIKKTLRECPIFYGELHCCVIYLMMIIYFKKKNRNLTPLKSVFDRFFF